MESLTEKQRLAEIARIIVKASKRAEPWHWQEAIMPNELLRIERLATTKSKGKK